MKLFKYFSTTLIFALILSGCVTTSEVSKKAKVVKKPIKKAFTYDNFLAENAAKKNALTVKKKLRASSTQYAKANVGYTDPIQKSGRIIHDRYAQESKGSNALRSKSGLQTGRAQLNQTMRSCLQRHYAGYEYALCLYNNGEIGSSRDYLLKFVANNPQHSLSTQLLEKIESPLAYIVDQANARLDRWLSRESLVSFFTTKPPVKNFYGNQQPPVFLEKSEFETSKEFNKRVASAKNRRNKEDQALEKQYQSRLYAYNQALKAHKVLITKEQAERKKKANSVYLGYINEGITNVLGYPFLTEPSYDADGEKLFANLVSQKSGLKKLVSINVPLSKAEDFKTNISKVLPVLEFDINNKKLFISRLSMEFEGETYDAKLLQKGVIPEQNITTKVIRSRAFESATPISPAKK